MTDFEDTEWMGRAACRHKGTVYIDGDYLLVDADWWHPDGCENIDTPVARRICTECCPVLADCRAYIGRHKALGGIWAATTEVERYGKRVNHKPKQEAP